MAITIRAASTLQNSTTALSDTYVLPTGHTLDDLLLIVHGSRITGSVASSNFSADSGAYTETAYVEDDVTAFTEPHGIVFRKFHDGSEADPTVTTAAGPNMMLGTMTALTGVDQTTPIDATAVDSVNSGAATSFTPTGIDTVTDGAMVLSVVWGTGLTNFALSGGAEQGFTLLAGGGDFDSASGQDMGLGIAYKEIATATTVTCPTWTCTSSEWIATTLAFRPAGGGTAHTATPIDPEGLLDAIARVVAAVRSQTDPLGLTDSRIQAAASVRTVTDALGLLDTGSSVAEVIRDADLFWLTDAATRQADYQRPLTDPQGLTDSATYELTGGGTAHEKTVTDPLGLTDTAAQVSAAVRSQTDPLGLLDATVQVAAHAPTVTDPLGLVDSTTRQAAHVQTVTDPLGLTDAATYEQSGAGEVLLTDLLGLVDSGDATLEAESDLVGLVDSVSYELSSGITATITDPLGLVDSVQTVSAAQRSQTDPLGLTDSATTAATYTQTVTDPQGLTDSVTYDLTGGGVAHTATVTDGLGLIDTATTAASFTRVIIDPAGLSDTATTTAAFAQSFTDPLGLLDPTVIFHSAAIQPRWQESGPTTGEVDGSLDGGMVEGSPGRGLVEGDLVAVGQEGG